MRKIEKIIIHCSATPEGRHVTVKDITAWHKQRGFRTIGYHYVIYLNGEIHPGRKESEVGAHTIGQNQKSISICYIDPQNQKAHSVCALGLMVVIS